MPISVDVHVGARVRMTREFRGSSRESLAAAVGMPVEQLERCEQGAQRFSSRDLLAVARRLGVKAPFFFNGLPGREVAHEVELSPRVSKAGDSANDNGAARRRLKL